jgi:hypothetical protein
MSLTGHTRADVLLLAHVDIHKKATRSCSGASPAQVIAVERDDGGFQESST